MLKKLVIRNIALMDFAEVDFEKGLNVLSGETGAGKSVIIDSLNFVLGAKADKTLIRYGKEACSVQAVFEVPDIEALKEVLRSFDIEDDELIIARKFGADGRGEIKVNGFPFTAGMLKKITQYLVDIHGQSDHFYLLKESNQLELIDGYAQDSVTAVKAKLRAEFARLKEIREELEALGGDESARAMRLDILDYQIREISEAELVEGEEESLAQEREKLANAEKILQSLSVARDCLSGEGGVLDVLQTACRNVGALSRYGDVYAALGERMESLQYELDDVERALGDEIDGMEFDDGALERVESRLELWKQLGKKYGFGYSEIMRFFENATEERDKLARFDELSESLVKEESAVKKRLYEGYLALQEIRKSAAQDFSAAVTEQLRSLGMNSARFAVWFEEIPPYSPDLHFVGENGLGRLEFQFSANKGEPLKPLSKIISGGEISRFMLAVKTQSAKMQRISTYVFDEIDAGISGTIAKVVAEKFADIAKDTQILAITHLPQIAAMADRSLLIVKTEEPSGKTVSTIRALDARGKVEEVARLMGGDPKNRLAAENAEALIGLANRYKS